MPPHETPPQGLHLMAKPVGPSATSIAVTVSISEKEQLYPPRERFRMTDEGLRLYVQR
jgi:uncharacterized protein